MGRGQDDTGARKYRKRIEPGKPQITRNTPKHGTKLGREPAAFAGDGKRRNHRQGQAIGGWPRKGAKNRRAKKALEAPIGARKSSEGRPDVLRFFAAKWIGNFTPACEQPKDALHAGRGAGREGLLCRFRLRVGRTTAPARRGQVRVRSEGDPERDRSQDCKVGEGSELRRALSKVTP